MSKRHPRGQRTKKDARRISRPATKPSPPRPRARRALPYGRIALGVAALAIVCGALYWILQPRARSGLPPQMATGAARGYNVLLLTLDTTRADHIGCYGYARAETPVLDALAAEGVRFADAVSPVPITLPAHATILTGLDPPTHGARHNAEFTVGEDVLTLAEVLAAQDYETAAFVSAFVLDARFGLDQGFAHYDDDISVASSAAIYREGNERPASSVTGAAIQWLRGRSQEQPFFAWVHYYDPHNPYLPPSPYKEEFRDTPYDGEIAFMDHEIGRLLQTLDAIGAREQTLIVAVADHGEGLGEHDESTHTMLIYESTVWVPLILACPGLFAGPYVVDDVVVSIADVFPTVLDLLGLAAPQPGDGVSLLQAPETADRMVYLETLAPYFDNGWSPLFGLRRHGDKYIRAPRPEYYDLTTDPHELVNLAPNASGATRAARDQLAGVLEQRLQQSPTLAAVVASSQPLDPEARQRLESLGYIGSHTTAKPDGSLPDPKEMMPVLRLIDQANALVRGGKLQPALAAIRQAEARSPRDRTVLRTKGKILLFLGHDAEAEKALRAANAIQPHPDACLLLAQVLIKHGRLEEAQPLLEQTLELDPLHGGAFIARGDLQRQQGEIEAALASYRQAIEVDPYRTGETARQRIAQLQAAR